MHYLARLRVAHVDMNYNGAWYWWARAFVMLGRVELRAPNHHPFTLHKAHHNALPNNNKHGTSAVLHL
jgi:hypothetical protein